MAISKKNKNGDFEFFPKNSSVQIAVPFLLGAKLQIFEKTTVERTQGTYVYMY